MEKMMARFVAGQWYNQEGVERPVRPRAVVDAVLRVSGLRRNVLARDITWEDVESFKVIADDPAPRVVFVTYRDGRPIQVSEQEQLGTTVPAGYELVEFVEKK